jgi:PAS domain S-box-containing protein
MRVNEPVTNREIEVPDGEPLVSRTDTSGRIIFANKPFVEVSGYSFDELVGAPHSIVRHPHMPEAAFADLWATIKAGRPWEGLVKNRAKSGDFYWVKANVTPMVEDGKVAGYISIRSKPTRERVTEAEAAYARLRAARDTTIGLRDGLLIRRGIGQRCKVAWASIAGRLAVTLGFSVLSVVVVGWLGLQGMSLSNEALHHVYADSTVDTARIMEIHVLMRANVQQVTLLALEARGSGPASPAERIGVVRINAQRIDALIHDYMNSGLSPTQNELIGLFVEQRATFLRDGLQPALRLAEADDAAGLEAHLPTKVLPLFDPADATNGKLVSLQLREAETIFAAAVQDFRFRFWTAIGLVAIACAPFGGLGLSLLRAINRPLRAIGVSFDAIARDDLTRDIAMPATAEFWPITSLLQAMRARITYSLHERNEIDRRNQIDRRDAVRSMAEMVERDAKQAMERVSTDTDEMARQAGGMAELTERVSVNAHSVSEAAGQALANAQAVGASSEELSASIQEIANQIGRATGAAQRAVSSGERARSRINSLSEAAERIGDVVQLIQTIAGQTNLLALNATIEAARAGEAGRGFNVVASEVKGLAGQTARSTQEISRQIAAIQKATEGAVAVVAEVGESIEEIARISAGIGIAIEEQAAATQEIARNVSESSLAVQAVTERIADVSRDAATSRQRAEGIRVGSTAVANSIADLRSSIVRTIRTATADTDRRMRIRVAVDEACTIVFGGARHRVRLTDISAAGARLAITDTPPVGTAGTLLLGLEAAAASATFKVQSATPGSNIGVVFNPAAVSAAFRRELERLDVDMTERAA